MRLRNNITKTLKKKLFENPNPKYLKKEYTELMEIIFPEKDIFILFLNEENFEIQTRLAYKILLQLSYNSNFPPPTNLFSNILNFETQISVEKKNGYIGRDHFVHLVHLYILGIYIFLYHRVLNENILSFFQNVRRHNKSLPNSLVNVFYDFILAWRYFVLYHDLSYPIEYLLGDKNVDINKKQIFLEPFNILKESIGKDLTLKSLSKIIGVYTLINNESIYSLKTLSQFHIKENKSRADIFKYDVENFKKIEKVYGIQTALNIQTVFGEKNIIPVLYEKDSMVPLLIYIPKKTKKGYKIIRTKNYKEGSIINKIQNLSNSPFNKESFQIKNFKWEFFISKKTTLVDIINSIFPKLTLKKFNETVEFINQVTSVNYSMILSDETFNNYCFEIYMVLFKLSGSFKYHDKNYDDAVYKQLTAVIGNIGSELPDRISKILHELFSKSLKNIDFEEDMDENESIHKVVFEYFKKTANTYSDLSKKVSNKLESDIKKQFEIKRNLRKIRDEIESTFNNINITNNFNIIIEADKVDKNKLTKKDEGQIFKIKQRLNHRIKALKLNNYSSLIEYKPKFKGIRKDYFDHGINSSLIFLSVIDVYDQLKLNKSGGEGFKKLLNIALGIDLNKNTNLINFKYKNIFFETCFAIMTHNIYPKFLENKDYRTDISDSPFSFFAILMDSLQEWDRKFLINQSVNELPYVTYSKNFNIEIIKNKIRITEFDGRQNIQNQLKKYKEGINEYLKGASDFIELNLAEF